MLQREAADGSASFVAAAALKPVDDRVHTVPDEDVFLTAPAAEMKQLLQAIVDEAWDRFRIRPSVATGEQDAQREHLTDMRVLVGKYAGVELGRK